MAVSNGNWRQTQSHNATTSISGRSSNINGNTVTLLIVDPGFKLPIQKSTHWYVQSQRGLKNHFFHTHYLTTNEPLDVIVLLCYSFNRMRVSIQLLAAIQINQLIDWLIDWSPRPKPPGSIRDPVCIQDPASIRTLPACRNRLLYSRHQKTIKTILVS